MGQPNRRQRRAAARAAYLEQLRQASLAVTANGPGKPVSQAEIDAILARAMKVRQDTPEMKRDRHFQKLGFEAHQTATSPERRAEILNLLEVGATEQPQSVAAVVFQRTQETIAYSIQHGYIKDPNPSPRRRPVTLEEHYALLAQRREAVPKVG